MTERAAIRRWVNILIVALLAVWASLSLVRGARGALQETGSPDFNIYWYSGHYLWQGDDPYQAFLQDRHPRLPVRYLDGPVVKRRTILLPGMVPAPAITAPLVFLISLFSTLSWHLARGLWLMVSLGLVGVIPWMAIRLCPGWERASPARKWVLGLIFPSLLATRYALSSGQTTLLVFALMLGSLHLVDRRPFLAGVVLGMALSKYSLSAGVFAALLLDRRWRTVGAAVGVQVLGVLGLWALGGTLPSDILAAYVTLARYHLELGGVHLASLFSAGPQVDLAVSAVLTLLVGAATAGWFLREKRLGRGSWGHPFNRLQLAAALTLWALLVAYHRGYDALAAYLFLAVVACGLEAPHVWKLRPSAQAGLGIFLAGAVVGLAAPAGSLVRDWLPDWMGPLWVTLIVRLTTLILTASLAVSLALLLRGAGSLGGSAGPSRRQ